MRYRFIRLGRKGQALVEMALITPIILLIIMGIIDFGIMFNNYSIISNAAREGARFGVVGYNDLEINDIINDITTTLDNENLVIEITPGEAFRIRGVELLVKIDYEIEPITPLISAILPDPFTISSKTAMRIE